MNRREKVELSLSRFRSTSQGMAVPLSDFGDRLAFNIGGAASRSAAARVETTMKPEWNENTYEQQFDSSLRRGPKSRPVPVMTNLRMMDRATAREIMVYAEEAAGSPLYEIESREGLPLHPSLRAMGRHYFTW